jgi:hypothetical protein
MKERVKKMNRYVEVNIVDNEHDWDEDRVMDTYILINPNMEKLDELRDMINERFENENWRGYEEIDTFILENFEMLSISETVEIEW